MLVFSTLVTDSNEAPYWLGRYFNDFDIPLEKRKLSTLIIFAEQGALLNRAGITFKSPPLERSVSEVLFPGDRIKYEVKDNLIHRYPMLSSIFREAPDRKNTRYHAYLLLPFLEIYAAYRLNQFEVGHILEFEDLETYMASRAGMSRFENRKIAYEPHILHTGLVNSRRNVESASPSVPQGSTETPSAERASWPSELDHRGDEGALEARAPLEVDARDASSRHRLGHVDSHHRSIDVESQSGESPGELEVPIRAPEPKASPQARLDATEDRHDVFGKATITDQKDQGLVEEAPADPQASTSHDDDSATDTDESRPEKAKDFFDWIRSHN
tara:strand:+ start:8527 stop:9513 length:987 start_codon:yes stop_codon:yes gene_type:complete